VQIGENSSRFFKTEENSNCGKLLTFCRLTCFIEQSRLNKHIVTVVIHYSFISWEGRWRWWGGRKSRRWEPAVNGIHRSGEQRHELEPAKCVFLEHPPTTIHHNPIYCRPCDTGAKMLKIILQFCIRIRSYLGILAILIQNNFWILVQDRIRFFDIEMQFYTLNSSNSS
jgi:hypothetical protein